MHGGGGQQAGDRRRSAIHAAIGQDQIDAPSLHGLGGRVAQFDRAPCPGRLRPRRTLNSIGSVTAPQVADCDLAQLVQIACCVRIGCFSLIRWACLRRLIQQIAFAAQIRVQRCHQLFAIGIQRRIGHLREQLPEIVVEQAAACRSGTPAACRCPSSRGLRPVVGHRQSASASDLRSVYPNACWRTSSVSWSGSMHIARGGQRRPARSCSHRASAATGRLSTSSRLISLSSTMRPSFDVDEENLARLQPPFLDDVLPGRPAARRLRWP